MSTSSNAIDSSSDAVVPTELPSNSDIALSNDVKVAVGDDLLEPSTGTLTTEPSAVHDGGDTVVHDSVNEARVSGDEREIVMENVEKTLDEKEKEVNDEEKEGEFKVTDLVWAKVRNYPWWPGQIFDPSASTDVAKKHSNKKGFLIAYFGDQSFAWNEKSKIKPFRKNFFKMEKQSNSPKFLHAVNCALDEALRRIKFGLSCSCLSKEVYDTIKSQTFVNAGIKKEDSVINGGDNFSTVATFKPENIVQSVQDLAREQFDGFNRFQVMSLHTQLFAYYRWKGYHQFSTQYFLDGSDNKLEDKSESDNKLEDKSEVPKIEKPDSVDEKVSSKKRKIKDDSKIPLMKKDKKIVTVSEKVSKKRKLNGSDSVKLKKHKHVHNDDMIVKKKEKLLTKVPQNGSSRKEDGGKSRNGIPTPPPKRLFGVGASICKIAKQLSVSPLIPKTESQFQRSKESDSVDENRVDRTEESTKSKRSNSSLKTSKKKFDKKESRFRRSKESNSIDEDHVDQTEESTKSERKSTRSDSSLKKSKEKISKKDSQFQRSKESNFIDENPVDQTKESTKSDESTKSETKSVINDSSLKTSKKKFDKKESQFQRSKESNSIDENPVNQTEESIKSETKSVMNDPSLKTKKETFVKKESQFQRSKESNSVDENLVDQTDGSTKSETKSVTIDSSLKASKEKFSKTESQFQRSNESNSADENPVDQTEESTKSETSDSTLKTTKEKFTALILKFTNYDSIPSVPDLNDIFKKYGNVMESETEVLKKSSCAKVVFEEKSNAETAFSSAGKFSIFGPSLISYRLDYSPTPRKIYTRKGKKKNGKAIRFDD